MMKRVLLTADVEGEQGTVRAPHGLANSTHAIKGDAIVWSIDTVGMVDTVDTLHILQACCMI